MQKNFLKFSQKIHELLEVFLYILHKDYTISAFYSPRGQFNGKNFTFFFSCLHFIHIFNVK